MDPREGAPDGVVPERRPGDASDDRPTHAAPGLRRVPPAQLPDLLLRAIETASNAITIADARADDVPLVYANQAFLDLTGYPQEEVLGRNCRFLQGPETDPAHVRPISRGLAAGQEVVAVLRNHRRDGTPFWNEVRISPVRDPAGELTHFIGNQTDVTHRVEKEQRSTYLAYHDDLTGPANRAHVREHLDLEIRRAQRTGAGVAVVLLDLGGFDEIIETFGQEAGDAVLVQAARRLRAVLRAGDLVARLGEAEFVCVLPGLPAGSVEPAEQVARHISDALSAPFVVARSDVRLRSSIGWALYPQDATTAADLLHRADSALDLRRADRDGAVT